MLTKKLIELRTEIGMTRKDVAALLKIDQSTYGKYELGKRDPDYETLCKIADLFGTSVDYLLGRTSIKKSPEPLSPQPNEEVWSEDELKDIENFKEFIRSRRIKNK